MKHSLEKLERAFALIAAVLIAGDLLVGCAGSPAADKDHVIAKVLDQEIIMMDENERLPGLVLGILLEQYVKEKSLLPAAEEIDRFLLKQAELEADDRAEYEEERRILLAQLEEQRLTPEERETISSRLEMVNSLLYVDPDVLAYERDHPENLAKMNREIAEQTIKAWMINRSLFLEYGGRVIYQQAGPEPIDAYRAFLEQKEAEGVFVILDRSLSQGFWNYFTNETMHVFVTSTSEVEAELFENPWWGQ